jgi:UDP-N-acetylmuramoylalanine--D-glutamate ligase
MNFKNKQVVVVGLGKSGLAAIELLEQQGVKARATEESAKDSVVCLADKLRTQGIDVQTGGHTEDFLAGTDLIVTSPGVANTALPLKWARQKKVKVVDEIELAYSFCKSPIITITGTNGKSTTTSLVGHIIKKSGKDAIICGNIGNPFSGQVMDAKEGDVIVLEASSFQLSRIDRFRPAVAIFLNATDNHLDRHSDFKDYFDSKMRIFENQTKNDWAIINYEDKNIMKNAARIKAKKIFFSTDVSVISSPLTLSLSPQGRGKKGEGVRNNKISNFASIDINRIFVQIGKDRTYICSVDDLKIKGRHNLENALAAISAVFIFGVEPKEIAKAIKTFRGLEHRCEYVATIKGVRFINDSKSTTTDAAIKALDCCGQKVILIAGGRDKNTDFRPMINHIKDKVKALILIGEAREKIRSVLSGTTVIKGAGSLNEAVESAFNIAKKGEDILLSPMCTSFDMFDDFEHRGRVFKDSVKRLERRCARQG